MNLERAARGNALQDKLVEALLRSWQTVDPYVAEAGQQLQGLGQRLEGSLEGENTLERAAELIPRWLAANPAQAAGALLQMREPQVEQLQRGAAEAYAGAYDQPLKAVKAVGRAGVEAIKDPLTTVEGMSLSDFTGVGGLLTKLGAVGAKMTSPVLMGMALPSSRLRKGLVRRSKEELNEPGLTDIQQVAETFKGSRFEWPEGGRVLDLGGGKSDKAKDFMAERGVQMEVMDPIQRSELHNNRILEVFEENPADIVTINNVLNTIQKPALRKQVLEGAKALVKPGGEVRILIYADKGKGKGVRKTGGRWQENRKAKDYVPEVESVFGKGAVDVKGSYLIARVAAGKP